MFARCVAGVVLASMLLAMPASGEPAEPAADNVAIVGPGRPLLSDAAIAGPSAVTDGVTIHGPRKVPAGTPVWLTVHGLGKEYWADTNWVLYPNTPDVQFLQLADLSGERVMIFFWAPEAGKWLIGVDVNIPGAYQFVTHELTCGEPVPPPPPPPPPIPNPYDPPAPEWKALAEPLAKFSMSRNDSKSLSAMYAELGESAARGDAGLSTTGGLRQAMIERGKPLGLKEKYTGLAEAVEVFCKAAFTLENRPLNRSEAGKVLRTMAWAIWEAGK